MELLLRVLIGIAEVVIVGDFKNFGDFENFENLTVGFAVGFTGERLFDLIGELIFLTSDLKIGFTFNGFFQADSGLMGDTLLIGSSAKVRFSVIVKI